MKQKITTFLWFDTHAEEAARFYASIFKNSKVGAITRFSQGSPMPEGTVMTVTFDLAGQEFVALNGGPVYKFTEAISLMVECDDQAELDHYWSKLLEGGMTQACGWLKDKYGLSWQIVPKALLKMLADPDKAKAARVTQAMLQMIKLDVAKLEAAYAGR
jgi:predicted 3-demethylubiquinone-9 3-methyltransferase (glyoxalase superfamily)